MAERVFSIPLPPDVPIPRVMEALQGDCVDALITNWRYLAREAMDTGDYAAALHRDLAAMYPYLGDEEAVGVINPMPYADYLEHGRVGFHLPSHWGRGGGKWKVSRKGKLYAHVPFRHRTPEGKGPTLPGMMRDPTAGGGMTSTRMRTMMPRAVYKQAKQLAFGEGRLTGFGDDYKRSKPYDVFRDLWDDFPSELDGVIGYTWKASPFEGMMRVNPPSPAGGPHTEYMTIRTITPDSEGWYIPPTPPMRFAERALEESASAIQQIIDAAAAEDAVAALMGSVEGLGE